MTALLAVIASNPRLIAEYQTSTFPTALPDSGGTLPNRTANLERQADVAARYVRMLAREVYGDAESIGIGNPHRRRWAAAAVVEAIVSETRNASPAKSMDWARQQMQALAEMDKL